MKRYAIVRVDNRCPDFFCKYKVTKDEISFSCNDCNLHGKYGDTKEQLVRKVAQVLYRDELRFCIWKEDIKYLPKVYERCLEKARKIVEFLGVE